MAQHEYSTQEVLNEIFDRDSWALRFVLTDPSDGEALGSTVSPLKISIVGNVSGEDSVNQVLKTEHRFEYKTELSADGAFITGAGFVHLFLYSCTIAGVIVLRDSTTAGGGTIIKTLSLPVGVGSLLLDFGFGTGLYADFDGIVVATVNVSARVNN